MDYSSVISASKRPRRKIFYTHEIQLDFEKEILERKTFEVNGRKVIAEASEIMIKKQVIEIREMSVYEQALDEFTDQG